MAIHCFYMRREIDRLRPAEDEAAEAKAKQARDVAHQAEAREQEKIDIDAQAAADKRERYRAGIANLIGQPEGQATAKALIVHCRNYVASNEQMLADVDAVERGKPLPEEATV